MSFTTGSGSSQYTIGHERRPPPVEGHSVRASGDSSAVDGPYSCGGVIVRCHVRVWFHICLCAFSLSFSLLISHTLFPLLVFAWVQRVDICFMLSRLISWNDLLHRWRNSTASVAVPPVATATAAVITTAQIESVIWRLPWTRECLRSTAKGDWLLAAVQWWI